MTGYSGKGKIMAAKPKPKPKPKTKRKSALKFDEIYDDFTPAKKQGGKRKKKPLPPLPKSKPKSKPKKKEYYGLGDAAKAIEKRKKMNREAAKK